MKDLKYNTAKLAQEKGFPKKFCTFGISKSENIHCTVSQCNLWDNIMPCCSQSELQKWVREIHKIHIEIKPTPFGQENFKWTFKLGLMEISSIPNIMRKNSYSTLAKENESYFDSYEEALEEGLLESLKLLIV